jgi:hypothetical protein
MVYYGTDLPSADTTRRGLFSSDSEAKDQAVIAQASWPCIFHSEYSVASGNTNEWSNFAAYTKRDCSSSFILYCVSYFIHQMDRFLKRVGTVGHTANSPVSSTALRAQLFKRLNQYHFFLPLLITPLSSHSFYSFVSPLLLLSLPLLLNYLFDYCKWNPHPKTHFPKLLHQFLTKYTHVNISHNVLGVHEVPT